MTDSFLLTAGSAMANHLWQTTVFAALIWLLTLLFGKNPARIRYTLWLAASLKFLLPFSLLVSLGGLLPKPQQIPAPAMYLAIGFAEEPFSKIQPAPITTSVPRGVTVRDRILNYLPFGLTGIWVFGSVAVLLMWYVRWHKLSATLRQSRPASVGREVSLLRRVEQTAGRRSPMPMRLSTDVLEPGIFGVFRPVLLWPEQLSEHLADEHIEAILTHELMHVQWYDNLAAELQMLVEALFWFHPLVWWMERRMVEERERACDEAVVRLGGQPEIYAESLLKACRFCVESPLQCYSGITGAGLNKRIVSVMTMQMVEKLNVGRKVVLITICIAAIATPLMLGEVKGMQGSPTSIWNSTATPVVEILSSRKDTEQMSAVSNVASNAPSLAMQSGSSAIRPTPNSQAVADKPSHLTFEVATIKQSAPGESGLIRPYPGADGYTVQNMAVRDMISVIYRVPGRQITGMPDWMSSEKFDVEAKADRAYSLDDLHEMFRNMLEERFDLRFHKDIREGSVYDLTIVKSGLKMKPNGSGQDVKIPIIPGPKGFTGTSVPMQYLCWWLGQMLRDDSRPVIDKTGLTKNYDFAINFAPQLPPGVARDQLPPELLDLPSIFDALKEELGLQLTPTKGPVEYYVIDHVEKPSPN